MPPLAEKAPRVLLFDGEPGVAPMVAAALDGTGCELVVHSRARGIADELATLAPDVVLVNVNVKDGGFALCGELRSLDAGRQLPIVLVTRGAADEQLVTRGLLSGADDFACITERMGEFQARVRVQLRHKRERDRLHRVRAERDSLRREATLDGLTELPNRRTLDAHLEEAWAAGKRFAVVFVDVDDFKSINDTLGHDAGDRVLRRVAGALALSLPAGDRCGRWGGEEFVSVLSGGSAAQASLVAESQRHAVERVDVSDLGGRTITASFGVAVFDPTAPDASYEALCHRADSALYEAKRTGKNRVVLARPMVPSRQQSLRAASPSGSAPPNHEGRAALEAALSKELATGRAGLPVLPEAAQRALELAENPRTDMGNIARLVDRDPPLAARFVAVAGSALYSRGVKPSSTHAALVRIGLATARDLLLQIAYEQSSLELPLFRAAVQSSFQRSVRCGIAARLLAGELRVHFESAYLCGLLHDIGEARIYRILAQMPLAFDLADHVPEIVARHHQRAGADVARAWRLPQDIVDACAYHHGAPSASLPVRIVMGADALVGLLDHTPDSEMPRPELAVLRSLGVTNERAMDIVDRVRAAESEGAATVSNHLSPNVELEARRDRGAAGRPSLTMSATLGPSRYPRPPSLLNVRIRTT